MESRYKKNDRLYSVAKTMELDEYNELVNFDDNFKSLVNTSISRKEYQDKKRYESFFSGMQKNIDSATEILDQQNEDENHLDLKKDVDLKALIEQSKEKNRKVGGIFSNTQYEILKNIDLIAAPKYEVEEDMIDLTQIVGQPTQEFAMEQHNTQDISEIERIRQQLLIATTHEQVAPLIAHAPEVTSLTSVQEDLLVNNPIVDEPKEEEVKVDDTMYQSMMIDYSLQQDNKVVDQKTLAEKQKRLMMETGDHFVDDKNVISKENTSNNQKVSKTAKSKRDKAVVKSNNDIVFWVVIGIIVLILIVAWFFFLGPMLTNWLYN